VQFDSDVPRRRATVVLSLAFLVLGAACSKSTTSASPSAGTGIGTGSSPTSAATSPPSPSGTAKVPSSCSAIPTSMIAPYIGGVAHTQSLGPPPNGVSCEFANASASKIVVVNIGGGATSAAFAALRTGAGQGGRTATSISGLGSSAFSISKNGVPGGVDVLTSQGLLFSVSSNLPLAQDEALIRQLMTVF
jgi:hypothetical protein